MSNKEKLLTFLITLVIAGVIIVCYNYFHTDSQEQQDEPAVTETTKPVEDRLDFRCELRVEEGDWWPQDLYIYCNDSLVFHNEDEDSYFEKNAEKTYMMHRSGDKTFLIVEGKDTDFASQHVFMFRGKDYVSHLYVLGCHILGDVDSDGDWEIGGCALEGYTDPTLHLEVDTFYVDQMYEVYQLSERGIAFDTATTNWFNMHYFHTTEKSYLIPHYNDNLPDGYWFNEGHSIKDVEKRETN